MSVYRHQLSGIMLPIFITMVSVYYFSQAYSVIEAQYAETGEITDYGVYIDPVSSSLSVSTLILVGGGLLALVEFLLTFDLF